MKIKNSWWYGVIWSAWLGFWLGHLGCEVSSLKFWYIFLPIVIFADLERRESKKEDNGV